MNGPVLQTDLETRVVVFPGVFQAVLKFLATMNVTERVVDTVACQWESYDDIQLRRTWP